ncbi:SDR family NAD(P)-dependent oxidoreductase [Novosphingobium resinovorum]
MLNGKAILITGAASGIGRRCAEVFAANGARVLSPTSAPKRAPRSSKASARRAAKPRSSPAT